MTANSNQVSDDRAAAWADAHDPRTTSAVLAEIVGRYPEFASAIVRHPNCYPELEKWAQSSGLLNPMPGASQLPAEGDASLAGGRPTGAPSTRHGQATSPAPPAVSFVPQAAKEDVGATDRPGIEAIELAPAVAPAVAMSSTPSHRPSESGAPVAGRVDLGAALSYGWRKFAENPWPFILMILMIAGLVFVSYLVEVAVIGAIIAGASSASSLTVGLILVGLTPLIPTFVGLALGIGLVRASIDTVRGLPVTFASSFRRDGIGQYLAFWGILFAGVLVLGVVLSFLQTVGTVLLFLAAAASSVFTLYAPYLILDRRMSAIAALRASCAMAAANLGQTFVNVLVLGVVSSVGGLLCGVGAFVTGPLTLIALASMYMSAQGEDSAW